MDLDDGENAMVNNADLSWLAKPKQLSSSLTTFTGPPWWLGDRIS